MKGELSLDHFEGRTLEWLASPRRPYVPLPMPFSPCGGRVFPRCHVPWTLAAVRRHLQPFLLRRLPTCPLCGQVTSIAHLPRGPSRM